MGRRRTWTDDDLREALHGARSMAEVVARLRLSPGGAAYVTVRTRMEQLGLSPPDTTVSSARPADREKRRGWSTAHWDRPLDREPRSGPRQQPPFREVVAGADLESIVVSSLSRAEVIRRLGHIPSSSTYRALKQAMEDAGLTGATFEEPYAAMRRSRRARYRLSLEDVLVAESTYTNIGVLKRRLVDEGLLAPVCAECGIDSWQGRLLTLHLDHINGVRNDHRTENLRLLCPNCHSQTGTFAGRNKGRYAKGAHPGPDGRLR